MATKPKAPAKPVAEPKMAPPAQAPNVPANEETPATTGAEIQSNPGTTTEPDAKPEGIPATVEPDGTPAKGAVTQLPGEVETGERPAGGDENNEEPFTGPMYSTAKIEQEEIDQHVMLKYAGVEAGDTHDQAHEKIVGILKAHYDQTHKSEHPDQFTVSLNNEEQPNDNYVYAERKNKLTGETEKMRFTKTTWNLLKNSREGWKKTAPVPPEVASLQKGK